MTKTEFIKKRAEELGLELVPYEALLSAALVEIGKLKSYIDELHYRITCLKEEINQFDARLGLKRQIKEENKETRKEVYREEIYQELQNRCNNLQKKVTLYAEEKNTLILTIIELRREISELKAS